MSIVAMKKLQLIAVQSQKKALLEDLLKLGCVQVSESEADLEGLMNTLRDRRDEGAMERRSQQIKILNALKVLDQYAPVKKGLLTPKPEAEKEAFLDEQALHSGVEAAEHILALDAEIRAAAASESRERALLESLEPCRDGGQRRTGRAPRGRHGDRLRQHGPVHHGPVSARGARRSPDRPA